MGANECKQLLLPLGAFAADLGESGRDHDERSHSLAERVLRCVEDVLTRHSDHRQVDGIGNCRHGGVTTDTGDRDPFGLTG